MGFRLAGCALAVAGLAVGVVEAARGNQCLEKYNCIFHHNIGSQEYSWDLHQLCRGPGNDYTAYDASNHTFAFNVCGNATQVCAPGWPLYDTFGVAVQTWSSPSPSPCPTTCTDDDGNAICCTGNCAVLAQPYLQFVLQNENNPLTGGILMKHVGMPPDIDDRFACPSMTSGPAIGLPIERTLTIQIDCDTGGSPTRLDVVGPATEPSACQYLIHAKSKAACGVKGDPFDGFNDDPAHSFGFVVLGATLAVIVYWVYVLGDARGWWEPIKSRLPCCRGGSSSSYKSSAGSFSSIGAATPITAGAYGSTA